MALAAAAALWYLRLTCAPAPVPEVRALFQGVTYRRDIRKSPRPLVLNVVEVDLTAPGVGFLVTPGDPKAAGDRRPLTARTTSAFLTEFGAQVAVNGDYFYPFRSNSLLDYYPHVGDPVDVQGFAASRGVVYCTDPRKRGAHLTLFISRDNRARFGRPIGPVWNAVSGLEMLVRDGRNVAFPDDDLEPCTAVGLDRAGRRLFIVVADGRQRGRSEGVTRREFADILRGYGIHDALDLDGGGSEALVAAAPDGRGTVPLNTPIDCHIPGRERAVANHLGIFARPLPTAAGTMKR